MSFCNIAHNTRKCFTILLIVLLLMNSFGFIILFVPGKYVIKAIVHQAILEDKIEENELIIISFNIQDLKNSKIDFLWEEEGREFRFNGKMYDVKKIKEDADSIHFTCYYDCKENILESLFTLFSSKSKTERNQINFTNLSFGVYYTEKIVTTVRLSDENVTLIPLLKNEGLLPLSFLDVLTPPPQFNLF